MRTIRTVAHPERTALTVAGQHVSAHSNGSQKHGIVTRIDHRNYALNATLYWSIVVQFAANHALKPGFSHKTAHQRYGTLNRSAFVNP